MKLTWTNALLLALMVIVLGAALYFFGQGHLIDRNALSDNHSTTTLPTTSSVNPDEYIGILSVNAAGQNVYTSPKYGFSFIYPKGWYVGDNHLGYGTFQLFNTDPASRSNSGAYFGKGENKIEMSLAAGI